MHHLFCSFCGSSAAAYPLPARYYVGYGDNDFPFYGKPYGHPSTPWTWSTLASYPAYGWGNASRSLYSY